MKIPKMKSKEKENVISLFERQVEQNPDKIAVEYKNMAVTYYSSKSCGFCPKYIRTSSNKHRQF